LGTVLGLLLLMETVFINFVLKGDFSLVINRPKSMSLLTPRVFSDYSDGADRSEGARGARCAAEPGAAARGGRRRQPVSGRPARRPLHHTQDGLQQFFLAKSALLQTLCDLFPYVVHPFFL
jgi:hypothetical protein